MDVEAEISEIKAHMPGVYRSIQDKAQVIGREAYRLVRRGLKGEPNCFYAIERGRVKGTPFSVGDIMASVAQTMVQFECAHVCIFPITTGDTNGTD